jgi:hypothetical protein
VGSEPAELNRRLAYGRREDGHVAKKNLHVTPHEDGWAVRGAGNEKATSIFRTQREAIAAARRIAENQRSELIVHGRNGRIRSKDSFGNDPLPPRDTEH